MRLLCNSLLILIFSFSLNAQARCGFDEFPRMDTMRVSAMGDNIQWNHTPLNARLFEVKSPLSEVRDFYTTRWKGAVAYSEFDGWKQILHVNADCSMLLQVKARDAQHSYGRMSISHPPAGPATSTISGSDIPTPPGARLLSELNNDDQGRTGHLQLIVSEQSLDATQRWYEDELDKQGWTLQHRSQQENALALTFAKARERLSVGLMRHEEKTHVLLNRMVR